MRFTVLLKLMIAFNVLQSNLLFASVNEAHQLLEFTVDSCRQWETQQQPARTYFGVRSTESDVVFGEQTIGSRYHLQLDKQTQVELEVIQRGAFPNRYTGSLLKAVDGPQLLLSLNASCELQVARRINYNALGQAINVVSLDDKLMPVGELDWLNPALVFLPRDAANSRDQAPIDLPLRVGMVDSGVNYRLPEINTRLARDIDGDLVGYDFWDMDATPYDAQRVGSGFFVQRHGTRTASVLLHEAPGIELVPYRYPRPDMSRMQALIEHASKNRVSIIGIPLGSDQLEDWLSFERAARVHPEILFVVSAGNNGRDIDKHPVYPASLDLDNILVVTSASDFVLPAERTNWGRIAVDFMVPAEQRMAIDYSGVETRVSGSSYAVSRVTALAARIKNEHRHWNAADIKREFRKRYSKPNDPALDWVNVGYIADPLAGRPLVKQQQPGLDLTPEPVKAGLHLSLELLVLDPRWSRQRVKLAVQQAYKILAQCELIASDISLHVFSGDDYLRDLSTGGAYTLLGETDKDKPTVVFARDTRMRAAYDGEAFGIANTRKRPWLANSVWLMLGVDNAGIALAHELYHLLANSGEHVEGRANLMQGLTKPQSVELTPEQCQLARSNGIATRLLHE